MPDSFVARKTYQPAVVSVIRPPRWAQRILKETDLQVILSPLTFHRTHLPPLLKGNLS